MFDNFLANVNTYYQENFVNYFKEIYQYPIKLVPLILDVVIVLFLIYKFFFLTKNSRVKQLIKGMITGNEVFKHYDITFSYTDEKEITVNEENDN